MGIKVDTKSFIAKAETVHSKKYGYSKTVYKKAKEKVWIECGSHGDFQQTPNSHLSGKGCPVCGQIAIVKNRSQALLSKKYERLKQPIDFKLIPLTRGFFAKVDNEDFKTLKEYNWCYDGKGYAVSKYGSMCSKIIKVEEGEVIDHINHDTLDNRRANIRRATRQNNNQNKRKHGIRSSRYKGVSWHKKANKWAASICINHKNIHLGLFSIEEEAAKAYNKKAIELFGEFKHLNIIKYEDRHRNNSTQQK